MRQDLSKALVFNSHGWTTWVVDSSFVYRFGIYLQIFALFFIATAITLATSVGKSWLLGMPISSKGASTNVVAVVFSVIICTIMLHYGITYRSVLAVPVSGSMLAGIVKKSEIYHGWNPSLCSALEPASLVLKRSHRRSNTSGQVDVIASGKRHNICLLKRMSRDEFEVFWTKNFKNRSYSDF